MKANKLMIGDWVIRGNITEEPMRITDICASKNNVYLDLSGIPILVKIDKINPIPITPEILEKIGFKNVSDHTLKGCDTYELSFGRDNDQKIIYKLGDYFAYEYYDDRWHRLFETQICHRWCVHNLQHALKLCGIEKEVVL